VTPYMMGYFDYNAGYYPEECPYWWGTWEYDEWLDGYFSAMEDG
jgi:ribosome modulation factor